MDQIAKQIYLDAMEEERDRRYGLDTSGINNPNKENIMEFDFKLDLDAATSASTGGRIETGIHKIVIEHAELTKSKNGNNLMSLSVKNSDGEVGFINNICMDKKWSTGKENFNYALIMELVASCRAKSVTPIKKKVKRKDIETTITIVKELSGKKCRMAIREEYTVYKNEESKKLKLVATFLGSGKTLSEEKSEKPATRIVKLSSRLEPFKTKEWLAWKNEQNGGSSVLAADDDDDFDFDFDKPAEKEDTIVAAPAKQEPVPVLEEEVFEEFAEDMDAEEIVAKGVEQETSANTKEEVEEEEFFDDGDWEDE